MDDLFAMIGNAAANGKGDNFRDGKGIVLVRELVCKPMNDGPTFIVATKIVSSEAKGDKEFLNLDPVTKTPIFGGPSVPNAKDSCPSWPQKLTKHKSAPGNVKAFVLALTGFKENEVKAEDFRQAMEKLMSKDQPGRGMLIAYETYQQAIRSGANAGKVITLVKWSHVSPENGNSRELIQARRAELDKTNPIQN